MMRIKVYNQRRTHSQFISRIILDIRIMRIQDVTFFEGLFSQPTLVPYLEISCFGPSFKREVALGGWGLIKNLQQQPNRNETVDPKQVKVIPIKRLKYKSNRLRTFLF